MASPSGLLPLTFLLLLCLQSSAAATLGQPKAFVLAWPLTSYSFPAEQADIAEDDYQPEQQLQAQPMDSDTLDRRLVNVGGWGAWGLPLWRSAPQRNLGKAGDQYAAGTDKRALSVLSRWEAMNQAHQPSRRIDKEFLPAAQTRSQSSSMRPINQPLRWGR